MEETDNEIIDVVVLRNYKSNGTGMVYINAALYSKLKPVLEGKKLVIRFKKDTLELCMKPLSLKYDNST